MKLKRASYQNGSVVLKERKKGPDVWVFRYYDANGVHRSHIIGTTQKYRTKAAAEKEAIRFRNEINDRVACISMNGLIDRYEKEGISSRHSTASADLSRLKRIREAFGTMRVDELARDIMAIEQWVNNHHTLPTATKPAREASKKTKMNMKQVLHRLFECAIKWGALPIQRNPVGLVDIRGRRKRVRTPNLITPEQWNRLVEDVDLAEHVKAILYVAWLTGLRASEILGLRLEDLDFAEKKVHVRRSVVGQNVDDTKTEASEAEVPMHEELEAVLRAWLEVNKAPDGSSLLVNGWLFGNRDTGRPYWDDSLRDDHLNPAGKKVGIPNLGFHDFRHTYRADLRKAGVSLEEQKAAMRQADIRTTLSYGGNPTADYTRSANAKVVEIRKQRAG